MSASLLSRPPRTAPRYALLLRYSAWDALPIGLALAHGLLLLAAPWGLVIALGLWWNSNSVSHLFLHKPFFRGQALNRLFACYLSVLLGIPQTLWRQCHLAHHADVPWRPSACPQLLVETALVGGLWACLLVWRPWFFLATYLPGYVGGLALCWLQGHYEHVPAAVSHHGRLYNFLFLNDGYHVEHHDRPGRHWTRLPLHARSDAAISRWPAVLRWLELVSLEGLERFALRCRPIQHFLLFTHERAFRRLLPEIGRGRESPPTTLIGPVGRVAIVGGGLFPRTALVLKRLLPDARLVIIDRSAANLAHARRFIDADVRFINETYEPTRHKGFDFVVFPLSYVGDRNRLYLGQDCQAALIHDWLWRRSRRSEVVSFLLLKRLNFVHREALDEGECCEGVDHEGARR